MFFNIKSKQIWQNNCTKKEKRRLRSKQLKKKIRKRKLKLCIEERRLKEQNIYCVKAPHFLSLSPTVLNKKEMVKATEHTHFIHFKEELENAAKLVTDNGQNKLLISFVDTEYLYADACILLIAVLDTLKSQYPNLNFMVKRPDKKLLNHRPNRDKHQTFNVDAVFCHVGLYKLLGYNYTTNIQHDNVQSWHYIASDAVDGDLTNPIFDELEKMGLANLNELYSGVIEGIANAVEHAYNVQIKTEREFPLCRWWMLMAKLKDRLLLYVCDLGHGIPNTIRFNKASTLLTHLANLVPGFGSSDCKDIQAATLIKETRTKLSHRGKGGQDIKSFINKTEESAMQIYSNRGVYRYNNRKSRLIEKLYDEKHSINGTILHWSIALSEKNK